MFRDACADHPVAPKQNLDQAVTLCNRALGAARMGHKKDADQVRKRAMALDPEVVTDEVPPMRQGSQSGSGPGDINARAMKFLPLVWSGLRRRPARSVLTAASIVIAFVLFGLLQGVNAGFNRAIADAHREFLITNTRVRGGAPFPISALAQIKSIPGVKEAAPRTYFVGSARGADPNSYVTALATDPDIFFDIQPAIFTSRSALDSMRTTRNGMLLTPPMLEQFGWKLGDTVPLTTGSPKTDGSKTWFFKIVGTIDTPKAPTKSYFGLINYNFYNDSRTEDRDTAEIFYIRIADPTKAIATAAAIDRLFANSAHETHTTSQQQRAERQAKQMGDVSLFTDAIMCAVIFTLAFVTGNTLRQSLTERIREFAVLKTLGYGAGGILMLAFAEALLLCIPAAILGLGLAYCLAPLGREDIGNILVSPAVVLMGLLCAACLALLGAAGPVWRISRMSIVAALGRR
jgi:putative ABC transport system permease protein